jgi:hypothetical protein
MKNGGRNILQAVDIKDARKYLRDNGGRGVKFCAVTMDEDSVAHMLAAGDRDERIDALLRKHRNYTT